MYVCHYVSGMVAVALLECAQTFMSYLVARDLLMSHSDFREGICTYYLMS